VPRGETELDLAWKENTGSAGTRIHPRIGKRVVPRTSKRALGPEPRICLASGWFHVAPAVERFSRQSLIPTESVLTADSSFTAASSARTLILLPVSSAPSRFPSAFQKRMLATSVRSTLRASLSSGKPRRIQCVAMIRARPSKRYSRSKRQLLLDGS
jgi:hypothetical protein